MESGEPGEHAQPRLKANLTYCTTSRKPTLAAPTLSDLTLLLGAPILG